MLESVIFVLELSGLFEIALDVFAVLVVLVLSSDCIFVCVAVGSLRSFFFFLQAETLNIRDKTKNKLAQRIEASFTNRALRHTKKQESCHIKIFVESFIVHQKRGALLLFSGDLPHLPEAYDRRIKAKPLAHLVHLLAGIEVI